MENGTDYAQQTLFSNLLLNETMRVVCYSQPIYDDLRLEGDEYTALTLAVFKNTSFTIVEPNYDEAVIIILDDDGWFLSYIATLESVLAHLRCSFTDAVVGLERINQSVSEDVGVVEVCVVVTSPDIQCPIEFPFNVSLSTADGGAGTYYSM